MSRAAPWLVLLEDGRLDRRFLLDCASWGALFLLAAGERDRAARAARMTDREPAGDVFFRLLRGLYESAARPAVYWHTVPRGLETALVLTHDVDAQESFAHWLTFARLAARYGVWATFFVTTKTFTDAADVGYYDAARVPFIVEVRKLGFEVGSHTVSHSKRFAKFPMGSPAVTAASYRPAEAPRGCGWSTATAPRCHTG